MKQIDILRRAKDYLDQLNNSRDPISGAPLPADSAARRDDVRRSFYFCSKNLGWIINYDAEEESRPVFSVTPEQISRLSPADGPVWGKDLVDRINRVVDLQRCRGLGWSSLMCWLEREGYLRRADSQRHYISTPQGKAVGIRTVTGQKGALPVFEPSAQRFIIGRLEDISRYCRDTAGKVKKSRVSVEGSKTLRDNMEAMELLSQGRDPVTKAPLAPKDPLGQERLRTCFAFMAQAIARTLEAGYFTAKRPFSMPRELWEKFPVGRDVLLSEMARNINAFLPDPTAVEPFSGETIRNYLARQGFLAETRAAAGRKSYRPTPRGNALGIFVEERTGVDGTAYTAVVYSPAAQQYLAQRMEEVTAPAAK